MMILYFITSMFLLSGYSAEVLTWDDCVREVTSNNYDLKVAKENVNVYAYKKKALWGNFMPSVSATLGDSYGKSQVQGGTLIPGSTNYYSASITASQNIFSGFQNKAQLSGAQANLEVQEWTLADVKSQVSFNLESAFAQILYAREYIKLTENIAKRRADNLNIVRLRFEGGNENKGSYLFTKAALDSAELDHIQSVRLLEVARQQLAAVLGRTGLGDDTDIKSDIPTNNPETNVDFNAIAMDIPSHQKALAQIRSNQANLTVAHSAFYPSLDFTATTSAQDRTWFPQSSKRWSVALGLTIPLFNGGRDFYTSYSASSALNSSMFSQQSVDVQSILNIKQAYINFVNAVEQVKVSNTFVSAATIRSEIARAKYNNGLLAFE
ncbi:MAG: TolC family protein, partial [Proteobacteria bacterium]|nr:TolC family protein [Pseudomonadota bacterium]